jgi:hypothetical protein
MEAGVHIVPSRQRVTSQSGGLLAADAIQLDNARSAVLVLHDKQDAPIISSILNRMAEHGYESLAIELSLQATAEDRDVVDQVIAEPVSWLSAQRAWTPDQVGIVGIGSSTRLAFRGAHILRDLSFVCIGAKTSDIVWDGHSDLQSPCLVLTAAGSDDQGESAPDRPAHLGTRHGKYCEVVRYAGVPPRFYNYSGGNHAIHAAYFDAWQRVFEWLDGQVAPRMPAPMMSWTSGIPRPGTR